MQAQPDPCVLVIFGASGDLTSRKIIPALYEMAAGGGLPPSLCVLGVSRTAMTDDAWRDELEPWVKQNAKRFDAGTWENFARRIHYLSGSASDCGIYPKLSQRIGELMVDVALEAQGD